MGKFIEQFSAENVCIDDIAQLFGFPVWITFESCSFYSGTIKNKKFRAISKLDNWESNILWDDM
jgi:hypothetical protein